MIGPYKVFAPFQVFLDGSFAAHSVAMVPALPKSGKAGEKSERWHGSFRLNK